MSGIKLLESVKLEEQTVAELSALITSLITKYKEIENVSVFWYSEKFSKECFMCVYQDLTVH